MTQRTDAVLMSRTNPTGWKLEELLPKLIEEINAKTDAVKGSGTSAAETVMLNNGQIVGYLKLALRHQEHTTQTLDRLGPDQGPTGTPRI